MVCLDSRAGWEPERNRSEAPLRYLDLETTGLHPERGQRITEAALIDRSRTLLHRCVEHEEAEEQLVRQVVSAIEAVIVVGHNVLFDLRFLAERTRRFSAPMPETAFVDTLRLFRVLGEDSRRGYGLGAVARDLDLDVPGSLHRALPDARLTRSVFERLVRNHGLETLSEAGLRRARWQGW